jgi:hypothetical protein
MNMMLARTVLAALAAAVFLWPVVTVFGYFRLQGMRVRGDRKTAGFAVAGAMAVNLLIACVGFCLLLWRAAPVISGV